MNGKYAGLPDIDSAPDVFESVDEPEIRQTIDGDKFDEISSTMKTQNHSEIDGSALPSRRRASLMFDSVPELQVSSFQRGESSLSRLRRLQAEVAELGREIEISRVGYQPDPAQIIPIAKRQLIEGIRPTVDLVGELSILRERLSVSSNHVITFGLTASCNDELWQNRLQTLERSDKNKSSSLDPKILNSGVNEDSLLGDVDKRLANLETLIGVASDDNINMQRSSLSVAVGRLEHLLSVLTQPRYIDSISRRVKILLVDLERAMAVTRRSNNTTIASDRLNTDATLSTTDLDSLQSLFSLLPRLDPLLPTLPPLVARLRSLSSLHSEALHMAKDLRDLRTAGDSVNEESLELATVVSGVQRGVTEAVQGIAKNWESLERRIQSIEQKLNELNM